MSNQVILDADQAAAQLCKRHLSEFVKEFWDIIVEDPLIWNWHMDALCNEVQEVYERVIARLPKEYDLIINVPPGTSKSIIATVMAPVWSWTRDPSLRHITFSYSDDLSTEHAVKSRDIIRSSRFKRYFPDIFIKKDEDNKTNYKTTRNGQRLSTGIGGTITGIHAHIQTGDDPLNPKQAVSPDQIETANRFFSQTLSTRKVDKSLTPLILIMQRLATNDPAGTLLEKKKGKIRHVCLPGEIADNVSPEEYKKYYKNGLLDSNRLSRENLEELRIDLGAAGYSGQIQQSPTPPGGLIWKKWFIEVPDELFPLRKLMAQLGTDWDLAYTKDEENAANAYITAGKIDNRIYLDDIGWRWLEFPELINWMKTIESPHYIEAKASGKSAKQTLTSQGIVAIEIPVKGGSDKIARANMSTPPAEAGMVYIRKSLADRFYNDTKQGILFFPKGPFKDLADVLAQCLQRLWKKNTIHGGNQRNIDDTDYDMLDL